MFKVIGRKNSNW